MSEGRCRRVSERMGVAALAGRPGGRRDRRHVARCETCARRVSRAAHARMVLSSMATESERAPAGLLPSVMARLDERHARPGRMAAVGSAVAVGLATAVATGVVAARRRHVAPI